MAARLYLGVNEGYAAGLEADLGQEIQPTLAGEQSFDVAVVLDARRAVAITQQERVIDLLMDHSWTRWCWYPNEGLHWCEAGDSTSSRPLTRPTSATSSATNRRFAILLRLASDGVRDWAKLGWAGEQPIVQHFL